MFHGPQKCATRGLPAVEGSDAPRVHVEKSRRLTQDRTQRRERFASHASTKALFGTRRRLGTRPHLAQATLATSVAAAGVSLPALEAPTSVGASFVWSPGKRDPKLSLTTRPAHLRRKGRGGEGVVRRRAVRSTQAIEFRERSVPSRIVLVRRGASAFQARTSSRSTSRISSRRSA